VAIFYFSLTSASLAVRRVKLRVAMGGHDLPEDTVHRRFGRSLRNFYSLYTPLADRWAMFDNSITGKATLVAIQDGGDLQIKEPKSWLKLQKLLTTC
jgi:predicted ABC-type ATPase